MVEWLNQNNVAHGFAMANPHLALDGDEEQVKLENDILATVHSANGESSARLGLELALQKKWMAIPRDQFEKKIETLFKPLGLKPAILNESFQADRLPELLNKIRPVWPKEIPLGEFLLIFPSQIPAKRGPGRPAGSTTKEKPGRTAAQLANDERLRQRRKTANA